MKSWGREARDRGFLAPGFRTANFSLAVFFRVTQDGLGERGTSRGLTDAMNHQRKFNSRLHYNGGIWKRRFHFENVSNVSVHTTQKEFINATITGQFGFVLEENSVRKITWLSWRHCFREGSVFIMFSVHTKRKSQRIQIPSVRSTVHTNPLRKRSFPKTLFKPEEFQNAGFAF